MKKAFLPVLLLAALSAGAQQHPCATHRQTIDLQQSAKTTSATPEEDDYDVKSVKLDLHLTPLSTAMRGTATTTALVTATSMPVYAFELDVAHTIDSVFINGIAGGTVQTTGQRIRKVTLPTALPAGQLFTARVHYHGQPTAGTGFFAGGLNRFTLPTGTNILYTLADTKYASEWWPAKQSVWDKIDSSALHVTVPAGYVAACNGTLEATVPLAGGFTRYEWKHRFPAKYYLLSAAIAPYTERSYTMQFADGDTMRIRNFVYDTAGIDASTKNGLDSVGWCLNVFSEMFGKYPFAAEKYGNCLAPLGGGMEHQTMTTLGYNIGYSVVMHELGHQWWGDAVSQSDWRHIWLSEGWATYCEMLYREASQGAIAARNWRTGKWNSATSGLTGSVIVAAADTANESAIFSSRLVYDKGAAMAHMLRFRAPSDSAFFRACRRYQQAHKYGSATTPDLQAAFETEYGFSLQTFFDQWVYGEGYPNYKVKWYYQGNTAWVQLTQTATAPAVTPFFATPVEVQFNTAGGPVVKRVDHTQPVQTFSFQIADAVTSVTLDPEVHILKRIKLPVENDAALGVASTAVPLFTVYPNPARDSWNVDGVAAGLPVTLFNVTGAQIWRGISTGGIVTVPAAHLPAGNYLLHVNGRFAGMLAKTQ